MPEDYRSQLDAIKNRSRPAESATGSESYRSQLDAIKNRGRDTPEAPATGADAHYWPTNLAIGTARGLAGLPVGINQRIDNLMEMAGLPAVTRNDAMTQFATHPQGTAQHIGAIGGAALPAVVATAATGGLAAPGMIGGALTGGIEGFLQPTESGTFWSTLPSTVAGAATGGVFGRLGASSAAQKALTSFNQKAYDIVLEPLRRAGFISRTPGKVGRDGINQLEQHINSMPNSRAKIDADGRLQQLKAMTSQEGHIDPGMIQAHFGKGYTKDPFVLLAEQGAREGVPSLYRRSGISRAALHLAPWVLRAANVPHPPGLHALANAIAPAGKKNVMSDLGWLASRADTLRRLGIVPAAGQTGAEIGASETGERGG